MPDVAPTETKKRRSIMEQQTDSRTEASQAFITPAQLAPMLGRSVGAIYSAISRHDVTTLPPYVRLGGRWVFPRKLLDEWLAQIDARALAECAVKRGRGRPRKMPAGVQPGA